MESIGNTVHWALGLIVLLKCCIVSCNLCTSLSNLPVSSTGHRLVGSTFDVFNRTSIAQCARKCLLTAHCCTFNFDLDTGQCELNSLCQPNPYVDVKLLLNENNFVWSTAGDWNQKILGECEGHSCPRKSRCIPRVNSYTCEITHCEASELAFSNISKVANISLFPVGHTLHYMCDHGYVPCGQLTCNQDGNWTSASCRAVQSCSDIKAMNSTYSDGEYWLHFPTLPVGVRMKVYCHNMSTSPREYITLPVPFTVVSPTMYDYDCTNPSPSSRSTHIGEFTFYKLGIGTDALRVLKDDHAFFNSSMSGTPSPFGRVLDCYTMYPNPCGPKGRGFLDMRNTGWKLKESVTWKKGTGGWTYPAEVTRSYNGQVIEIRCGGYCGDCYIDGLATLTFEPKDVLPADSATDPQCEGSDLD